MIKKAGNILYGLFVALLVGVAALLLVSLLPLAGGIEIKIVKSGSMEPTIHTGALVVILPEASYSVGDIVTFGKDTKTSIPTTHRIVSARQENGTTYFRTKGDANEDPDPNETPATMVIGKVLFSVPFAGYVLDFARRPLGFAIFIGLPAAMIIVDETLNIFKEVGKLRGRRRRNARVAQMPVPQKPKKQHYRERVRIPTI